LDQRLGQRYGVEAPYVPAGLAVGGVACLMAAGWRNVRWPKLLGIWMLAQASACATDRVGGHHGVVSDRSGALILRERVHEPLQVDAGSASGADH
jgi:hypothetical protein